VSARRGDVWLVDDVGSPGGGAATGRPVVVVSADALGESTAGVVLVVPTTRTHRGIPSHVAIEPGSSGLESVHYATCEDLRSVTEERLAHRLGTVSAETLAATGRILAMLLDL
jgi:mRNA interferase MazF